jgi:RNA polymerase sigma factor (sigma-70 family)
MSDIVRLIEPLIPSLRRYARALVRDRVSADDLVQDCLERAISRWHQRRADGDVRAWLFAILHNLAMTAFRRSASHGRHLSIDAIDEATMGRPPQQEDAMRYAEVLRWIGELPEEQRSVLLLVSVEDLSYSETARALNIPVGTVMSRLSRARERLLGLMEEVNGGAARAGSHLRSVK